MTRSLWLIACCILANISVASTTVAKTSEARSNTVNDARLLEAINSRPPKERSRDKARHPAQTLSFFGIRDNMTVVELWPGGGWYSQILSPYLNERGQLYAAHFHPKTKSPPNSYAKKVLAKYRAWIKANDHAANIRLTALGDGHYDVAPRNSADMVLSFRSTHNWIQYGYFEEVIKAAHRALKPNGILGMVGHRAASSSAQTSKAQAKTGYIDEKYVIKTVTQLGFELVASSEINFNPKDTANHPRGVWTLPPTLRGTKERPLSDPERQKYAAIGESDRFTLKFRKK